MRLDCRICVVRDWRPADKPVMRRLADNRNVWRNLSHRFPHPYTEADADSWFDLLAKTPSPTNWAIEVDGQPAGGIGVDPGVGIYSKSGRFGYWLGEPFWNRGIMTAAVRTTSDYILQNLGLVRLEAPVFAWNPASMRVLEKSGFVLEGVQRQSVFKDGEIIDGMLYARVR